MTHCEVDFHPLFPSSMFMVVTEKLQLAKESRGNFIQLKKHKRE